MLFRSFLKEKVGVSPPLNVFFMNSSKISIRGFASERSIRRKKLRDMKKAMKGQKTPELKETLRKLYMKTHPDLFQQYPKQQQINTSSYQDLLGMLDTITKPTEEEGKMPEAKTYNLPFFLKTQEAGKFTEVVLRMRTTGGACDSLMEEALGDFFMECNLPPVFKWSEGSWGKVIGKPEVSQVESEIVEEEVEVVDDDKDAVTETEVSEPLAPAYQQPISSLGPKEDNSVERLLNELNEVLEVIAAVPWLPEEGEHGKVRQHFMNGNGLDEYEENGYKIRKPIFLIWNGERDMAKITEGLDTTSAQVVQRVYLHTMNIERQINEQLEAENNEAESE